MSYKVLARKWRPKTFSQLVGQEHVLKALINALDNDRLHHAYLFTGTRGVGKTTIARILAKCLNCETGVTSQPCEQCQSCLEVDSGRFVDLIEVDAASRTKVEDTRELLDNVQYAPTRGRYKVYLIDEVHMLSGHSFNALLKTLEEPPPHVKFLLATTDPQKLPVTILSRCLQFNLKALSAERVVAHLKTVLDTEAIDYDEAALWSLARAADGSMRDAMSITEQAISFGAGELKEAEVRDMLGSVDRDYVFRLLTSLAAGDAAMLLQEVEQIAEQSPDFNELLAELIIVLHRIAIAQVAPGVIDDSEGDKAQLLQLSQSLPAETVQLYYQIALIGRRDQNYVPDPRGGLEMTLLRMLTFKPETTLGGSPTDGGGQHRRDGIRDNNQASQQVHRQDVSQTKVQNKAESGVCSSPTGVRQSIKNKLDTSVLKNSALPVGPQTSSTPAKQEQGKVAYEGPGVLNSVTQKHSANHQPGAMDVGNGVVDTQMAEAYESWAVQEDRPVSNIVEFPALEQGEKLSPDKLPDKADRRAISSKEVHKEVATAPDGGSADIEHDGVTEGDISENDIFWDQLINKLPVQGASLNLAKNCVLVKRNDNTFELLLNTHHEPLLTGQHQKNLEKAISSHLGRAINLAITLENKPSGMSPDALESKRKREALQAAEEQLRNDPVVQALINDFGASLLRDSIEPK